LRGVHGVTDDFAQENLLVRIEELLDDRENVFCLYSNVTCLLHICLFLMILIQKYYSLETVIAGLTRDLLNARVLPPREGDGVPLSRNDGSSAMTVKGWM
jgi:hypothetical protein